MKIVALILAIFLTCISNEALSERVEKKTYGDDCEVGILIDAFNDTKSGYLICIAAGDGVGNSIVKATCHENGYDQITLVAGIQFITESNVNVVYRFDKKKFVSESWSFGGKNYSAYVWGLKHASFLNELKKSKMLIFRVNESTAILDTSKIALGVDDYLDNCKSIRKKS